MRTWLAQWSSVEQHLRGPGGGRGGVGVTERLGGAADKRHLLQLVVLDLGARLLPGFSTTLGGRREDFRIHMITSSGQRQST